MCRSSVKERRKTIKAERELPCKREEEKKEAGHGRKMTTRYQIFVIIDAAEHRFWKQ